MDANLLVAVLNLGMLVLNAAVAAMLHMTYAQRSTWPKKTSPPTRRRDTYDNVRI
jgi:hypothetical protein